MAYDVVIKNGTVVDGTGREPYRADVAIQGDRIAEIGTITEAGKRTINADGQTVTQVSLIFILTSMRKSGGTPPFLLPAGMA